MYEFAIGDEVYYVEGCSAEDIVHRSEHLDKGKVIAVEPITTYRYTVEWEDTDPTDVYPASSLAPA